MQEHLLDDVYSAFIPGEEILWSGRPVSCYYIWSLSMYRDVGKGGVPGRRDESLAHRFARWYQSPYAAYLLAGSLILVMLVYLRDEVGYWPKIGLGLSLFLLLYMLFLRDLWNFLAQRRCRYYFTNKRLVIEEGLLYRRKLQLWLNEIEYLVLHQHPDGLDTLYIVPPPSCSYSSYDFRRYQRRFHPTLEQLADGYRVYEKLQAAWRAEKAPKKQD